MWDRWNVVKKSLTYTESNMCLVEANGLNQGLTDASVGLKTLDDSNFAIFRFVEQYSTQEIYKLIYNTLDAFSTNMSNEKDDLKRCKLLEYHRLHHHDSLPIGLMNERIIFCI